jgi:anthranilate phosphoribosyltransferase
MFREQLSLNRSKKKLDPTNEISNMISAIFSGGITPRFPNRGLYGGAWPPKARRSRSWVAQRTPCAAKPFASKHAGNTVVDTCGTGGDGSQHLQYFHDHRFRRGGMRRPRRQTRESQRCPASAAAPTCWNRWASSSKPLPKWWKRPCGEIGIGFLFAPLYHGAMRFAIKARQGGWTCASIFNMLGPLTNPAASQLPACWESIAPELTEMFAQALRILGTRRAFVVHGHDGLDEISVCDATRVTELRGGQIQTYDLNPQIYFGELSLADDMSGGSPQENADITRAILKGEKGPKRNVVLINTAAALMAADKAKDMAEGIGLAKASIDTGAAMNKLQELIRYTQENAV